LTDLAGEPYKAVAAAFDRMKPDGGRPDKKHIAEAKSER